MQVTQPETLEIEDMASKTEATEPKKKSNKKGGKKAVTFERTPAPTPEPEAATAEPELAEGEITLAGLAKRYVVSMQRLGKTESTCASYANDLALAQRVLGEHAVISKITIEDVRRFNESDEVTKLRSGKPRAKPTIDKARRVLRLALCWAAEKKFIDAAPYEAKSGKEDGADAD